jgi:ribosomal protein S18 acetylase RimI-like enzyme
MVSLRPMSSDEFRRYLGPAISSYGRMHHRAGIPLRRAMARARKDYAQLLPKGLKSPGHFLYSFLHRDKAIGMAWFELQRKEGTKKAFIFDINLKPAERGKGLGRKALRALEREARRLGAQAIGLHVFGHNRRARALYESSGYRYTSMHMSKALRSASR